MKSAEALESTEHSVTDFVDWAYKDTLRNAKTTRNFIMGMAERLKTFEDKISQTILPKLMLNKQ
jgi:hypothetical protein